jgi:uncharacterized protein YegL
MWAELVRVQRRLRCVQRHRLIALLRHQRQIDRHRALRGRFGFTLAVVTTRTLQLAALALLIAACPATPPSSPPPRAMMTTLPSLAAASPPASSAPPAMPPLAVDPSSPALPPPPAPASEPPPTPPILCRGAGPTLALSLLLDRSGSMTGLPIEMTKTAARQIADALTPTEAFEVIAFDSSPRRFVTMTCGQKSGPALIQIAKITPGGGTEIFSALDLAHSDLAALSARRRHIVLLTDGRAPRQGIDDLVTLLAAEGMTLSTIALGADADETMLRAMAEKGHGHFYQVSDPSALLGTFARELAAVRGTPK